ERLGGRSLVSRVRNPLAFGRHCIPAGCVAHRSNISDILALRALLSGRIVGLGAQRISDSGHKVYNTAVTRRCDRWRFGSFVSEVRGTRAKAFASAPFA